MRNRLVVALAFISMWGGGQAMALVAPTINSGFCGSQVNYVSFSGGGPLYAVYKSYSTAAGRPGTWSPPVETQRSSSTMFVHYNPDPKTWWRYHVKTIVEAPLEVSAPSNYFFCPFWRTTDIPLSDAGAAAYVTVHEVEIRGVRSGSPDNVTENNYVPSDEELTAFLDTHVRNDPTWPTNREYSPYNVRVTGRHNMTSPSTGDLIQWAAVKWGIPVDIMRSMAVGESNWFQNAMGDDENVGQAVQAEHPAHARFMVGAEYWAYESLGITQIKWRGTAVGAVGAGTEPLRWKSTAWNLDYAAAGLRYYFDGYCDWCDTNPVPPYDYPTPAGLPNDHAWMSVGAHFEPSPWGNGVSNPVGSRAGQLGYLENNKDRIVLSGTPPTRAWEKAAFISRTTW